MKAAVYKRRLFIRRGDTFRSPVFRLPDLAPYGGPHDLSNSEVTFRLAKESGASEVYEEEVEYVDRAARRIRLVLSKDDVDELPYSVCVWDVHVADGEWEGTPLQGTGDITTRVTA